VGYLARGHQIVRLIAAFLTFLLTLSLQAAQAPEDLWDAARKGDDKAVAALLDKGIDVNAKTRYGATALWFAAYKGHLNVVQLLVDRKADVNVMDTVWGQTPLLMAAEDGKSEILKVLLAAGARGSDAALLEATRQGKSTIVQILLDKGHVTPDGMGAALLLADKPAVRELLVKAGAKPLGKDGAVAAGDDLAAYVGNYQSPGGLSVKVQLKDGRLVTASAHGAFALRCGGRGTFEAIGEETDVVFERQGERVVRMVVKRRGMEASLFGRIETRSERKPFPGQVDDPAAVVARPGNWPSFRGAFASGVADGQLPPTKWDVDKAGPRLWMTPIPGLGHSCPIIWGDRIFVSTAVSNDPKSEFKPGLYGAGTSAKDMSKHSWRVYCLDKRSGKILWERTACEGVPKLKRHIKSSHANPTPATDGNHLVVLFASEGLYCYDLDGKPLWQRDLGLFDAGAFNDPDLQWGAASSPILYKGLVFVQCDRHKDSFLAAYDVDTGKPVWTTPRDEQPSWATPTVYEGPQRAELIANGTNYVRAYDPFTGKELWRLGPNAQITVPTPIASDGLIYVTSGYRPIQPIYAVWAGASGDLSLHGGAESSDQVAWSKKRGGPYLPTPILYHGRLYTCSNNGMVACHEARTGKQIYQERLGGTGGYSASPVAADGKVYFTSEEGKVSVVKAGPSFELLAVNQLGDACMATPAIADGMIIFRTQHLVLGISR
jgi:outer membrane protein assembly factor BamB